MRSSLGRTGGPEGESKAHLAPWLSINPDRSKPGGAPWREFEIGRLAAGDARIRCRHSEPPPPYSYAITLELLDGGEWHTIRLWDNADGFDEHHEHAYTRSGGKQWPTILDFATANEAMAAAIAEAKRRAEEIVRQWRAS
jgi:hypothetical protein